MTAPNLNPLPIPSPRVFNEGEHRPTMIRLRELMGESPAIIESARKPAHQSRPPPHTGIGMAARKPVLRRLRGVWRCRCRQVVTAERHLYGDRDPVLETSKLPNSAGDRRFESISLER